MRLVWQIFSNELLRLEWTHDARPHAFVLMPNHIHLLISTPDGAIDSSARQLFSRTTRQLNWALGRSGRIFGAPYFRTLIASPLYFRHAMKYVYRNPVKARLCESVDEYEFSTLRGLLGAARLPFPLHLPLHEDFTAALPGETAADWLTWLNEPYGAEAEELLQNALRSSRVLEVILDRSTRRPAECLRS